MPRGSRGEDAIVALVKGFRELGARADAHLVVDVLDVVADRVDADAQRDGDLARQSTTQGIGRQMGMRALPE